MPGSPSIAGRGRRGLHDRGDVGDADRLAGVVAEHDTPHLLDRCGLGIRLDDDVLVGRLDEPGPRGRGGLARGLGHVRDRQPVAAQPRRIDLYLPLAHVAAEHVHLSNPGHRKQMRPHRPVGQRSQLHQRALR
jgi:hypothetical protein